MTTASIISTMCIGDGSEEVLQKEVLCYNSVVLCHEREREVHDSMYFFIYI